MLTLSTPYLHVQAIRRMYKDQGKPTHAKPGWYALPVNYVGTAAGEVARNVLSTDDDSDFVWLSLYHYFQQGAYSPDVGSVVANAESGQFTFNAGAALAGINVSEIRITPQGSGRTFHNSEFIDDGICDFLEFSDLGQGGPAGDFEIGKGAVGLGHPFEDESTGVGNIGGVSAVSVWRAWLNEPWILPAGSDTQVSIRRKVADALIPLRGHLFLFWGVRLYVGRA